jgi:hypothetical protein
LVTFNNLASITVTVPAAGTVNFTSGQRIDLVALGTGQVAVTNASGVTINSTPGRKLRTQFSSATLVYLGTNSWYLAGDLSV